MSPRGMRAARLHGIRDLRLDTLPIPEPGPRELLVRIEACGVCSTDARKYRIGLSDGGYPQNPGHEWVGTVVAIGAEATGWEPGMRAYGDTYGGYAEFATITTDPTDWSCGAVPLDGALPLDRVVFLEPLADCLHAIEDQAGVRDGERVVVIGGGSMGIQLAWAASRSGGHVLMVEPLAERRELAFSFGAASAVPTERWEQSVLDWSDGHGADVVVVAVGRAEIIPKAIEAVAAGGRVVLFAGFGDQPEAAMDLNRVHYREIALIGSEWIGTPPNQRRARYAEALEALASGEPPLERLVGEWCGFETLEGALASLDAHVVVKTVFGIESDRR